MIQDTPRIFGSTFYNHVLVVIVIRIVLLVVIVLRTIYVITKTPTKTYYAFSGVVRSSSRVVGDTLMVIVGIDLAHAESPLPDNK